MNRKVGTSRRVGTNRKVDTNRRVGTSKRVDVIALFLILPFIILLVHNYIGMINRNDE